MSLDHNVDEVIGLEQNESLKMFSLYKHFSTLHRDLNPHINIILGPVEAFEKTGLYFACALRAGE